MSDKYIRSLLYPAAGLCLAIVLIMLSGCGQGLSKGIKQSAKKIPDTIQAAQSFVKQQQEKYQSLAGAETFTVISPIAKKENWQDKFTQANKELDRTAELYKNELTPLIKKDKPELTAQVQRLIHRINKTIITAKNISQQPVQRFELISNTISDPEKISNGAEDNAARIQKIIQQLEQGPFTKAFDQFPDSRESINARLAPYLVIKKETAGYLATTQTEYQHHKGNNSPDYAAFTDSATSLSQILEKIKKDDLETRQELEQLYVSYTKILKDMKIKYQVTVKRESWDESSDYYSPQFATFTREVPQDVYETVTADNIDTIAQIIPGRFSSKIGRTWNQLNINPMENWPGRNHNAASFWVENSRENYYHQYILEQDGQTEETGWQQVSEGDYEAKLALLGMAVLAKPYGVFEQDILTQAAPPGMAYVGNSRYGEWKEGDDGDRFWSWYGRYAFFSNLFFFPPYYYGYRSWHGWHNNYRHKKPYFGKTREGFQKFGTSGTFVRKSPKFQNTSFAKSGGFKTQTASVRGAGAGLKGGGPGGKGK